jgi:hypothetical protein
MTLGSNHTLVQEIYLLSSHPKDSSSLNIDKGVHSLASEKKYKKEVYVREIIHHDQQDKEKLKAMENAITKGLESGISNRTMQDILKKARFKAKAASRN